MSCCRYSESRPSRMATGDFLASDSAISLTVESRCSCATTRLITPSDCSCVAVQRSPSISISRRTLRGMLRERMAWIIIGQIPTLISGVPKVAVSTATSRSHEHASPSPPASVWPLMRPTIGLPSSAMRMKRSTNRSRLRNFSRLVVSPSKVVRSAPAQNTRPAPVRTTTRTSGSCWHQRKAAARSLSIVAERGLRWSGRFSVLGLILLDEALLEDGVAAGQDQDRAANVLPVATEQPRHLVAQKEAEGRHEGLEEAEGKPDSDSRLDVDPAQPDSDRAGEVAQADRNAHQQQAEKRVHEWELYGGYKKGPGGTKLSDITALLNKNTLLATFGTSTIAPNLPPILSPKVRPAIA